MLGCKMVKLAIKYLGLSLRSSYKDEKTWNLVIEKFERRLAEWKRNLLYKVERFSLVKNMLVNLSTTCLS